jgi:hypothetical protein
MEAQSDFRELLALFNDHGVEYVVVGAYALAFHGAPRTTGDLDLLVATDAANADAILRALEEFGFGSLGLSRDDFQRAEHVIQLGVPPVRIDLLTSLTAVSWDEVWTGRVQGAYDDVPVPFLGIEQLRKNKRALGRHKDLADLEALGDS